MGINAELTNRVVATRFKTLTPESINAARRLSSDRAERLIGLARRAEALSPADVRALLKESVP